MTATADFLVLSNPAATDAVTRAEILRDPPFGVHLTDHMVTIGHDLDRGWHDARVQPLGPLSIMPGASALQYAQQVFEGLKAYRHADGSIWTFRPLENAERLRRSAARFSLAAPDDATFLESLRRLVDIDHEWVPDGARDKSLYLRPFVIGTEQFLGVRASSEVTYCVIASPAGSLFAGGVRPVNLWLADRHTRAAPGGTGEAKCGGNYAAGLAPAAEAKELGCDQPVFLDAETRTRIEELGTMNIMFVTRDRRLVTPDLSGTILRGITRRSLLQIGQEDLGLTVEERPVTVDEWREGVADGSITEIFACGTAAVVIAVATLKARDFTVAAPRDTPGPVAMQLRERLTDIQYGRAADTRDWMVRLR